MLSKIKQKKCKVCDKEFQVFNTTQKFCSARCQKKHDIEKQKIKKAKIKLKKQLSISFLEKKLDVVFSKYIRLRDCIATTWTTTQLNCFICDELIDYEKSQAMHFIPRQHKATKFDESNVFGGCMRWDVFLHGNYLEYFIKMEQKFGRKKVDELLESKKQIYLWNPEGLLAKIDYFNNKFKELNT